MAKANLVVHLHLLLLTSAAFSSPHGSHGCPKVPKDVETCLMAYEGYQTKSLSTLQYIFDEEQMCSPCPGCDKKIRAETARNSAKFKQKSLDLIAALTASKNSKQPAEIPEPTVTANVNASVTFSCESGGEPLTLCLWEWSLNDERKVILMDQDGAQISGGNYTEGMSFGGDGLLSGKCGIIIRSPSPDHFGRWTCTLVSDQREIFSGEVTISPSEVLDLSLVAKVDGISSTVTPAVFKIKCQCPGLSSHNFPTLYNELC